MSIPIKHLFHINAPADKVFKALTDIEQLKIWYTTDVSGRSDLGYVVVFMFGNIDFKVKIITSEAGKKLEWECIECSLPMEGHKYIFELDENEGKTRLKFTELGFTIQDDAYSNMNFSWGKYLESLRQFCQKNVSEAFGSPGYRS